MKFRARVALGLAVLFASNFALTEAAIWLADQNLLERSWSGPLAAGLLFGVTMTLVLWLTFGDGKWYWRLFLCFASIVTTAFSMAWVESLSNESPASFDEIAAWWAMLVLLWMLLIGFATLWPLRRLRGWRLTWRQDLSPFSVPGQFHSRDLLFWMFAIAGGLAAFRALSAVTPVLSGLGDFIVQMFATILLAATAMHVAYGQRRVALQGVGLFALAFMIGGGFVATKVWNQLHAGSQTLPWQNRIGTALLESLPEPLSFLSVSALVLSNFLALRALGCRLIQRPGTKFVGRSAAPVH